MPLRYITEYNPDWPRRFTQIADVLAPCLLPDCQIHHVGSTAVPGMPAKDIIDLDIQCACGQMPQIIEVLTKLGYRHAGDQGIPGREAFHPLAGTAIADLPAHHLYACEADTAELAKTFSLSRLSDYESGSGPLVSAAKAHGRPEGNLSQ